MRRSSATPTLDTGCNWLRQYYRTKQAYDDVYGPNTIQPDVDAVLAINGSQIDIYKRSNQASDTMAYDNAMIALERAETNLNAMIKCIQKDMMQRNSESSKLYTLQQELEELRKEAKDKKEIAATAKERSNLLDKPYSKTTWYEPWFPLGRPLRKESVPVLLAVSILMLVFATGIFLRLAGIELRFESIQSSLNLGMRRFNSRIPQ
jgi:hypothetical protein